MHSPDKRNFDQLMDTLGETFGKPATDLMKQSYWMALKDQPWEVVEMCAKSHSRYGKFFPKPFELRPKDENRPIVRNDSEVQSRHDFVAETWEQMRKADPEKFWRDFKAAYIARLYFRFPVDSPQYREAYQRCVDRCDAELKTPSTYAARTVAETADDFF
jgi:hypothetical protein